MKKSVLLLLSLLSLTGFSPKKELSWMAIGDSITYHNGRPETTQNRITKGYMDDVVAKLPYIHFVNHGHGGWTAKTMADSIEKLGIAKADIYSVFLGTNDWGTGLPIGSFSDYQNSTGNATQYGAYRTIIDKIRSLNPRAVIILMTPMQRTDFVDVNNHHSIIQGSYEPKNGHYLSEYADAIKDIAARENFRLVDLYYKSGITIKNAVKYCRLKDPATGSYKNYLYPEYLGMHYDPADDYPYPPDAADMTYDGLHPSDRGHTVIAGMLVKIMKDIKPNE